MNKQGIFEGRKQILLFLRGPRMVFWTRGIKSLHSEPIGNKEDRKEIQYIYLH